VIVSQILTQLAGISGGIALARRYYPAGAGSRHVYGYIGLRVQYVDLADGDSAVVAGKAQLGSLELPPGVAAISLALMVSEL
jgi:hypothetical protein